MMNIWSMKDSFSNFMLPWVNQNRRLSVCCWNGHTLRCFRCYWSEQETRRALEEVEKRCSSFSYAVKLSRRQLENWEHICMLKIAICEYIFALNLHLAFSTFGSNLGWETDGAKLLLLFVLWALLGCPWPAPVLLTIGRCGSDSLSLVGPLFWFPIVAKITDQWYIMEAKTNTKKLAYHNSTPIWQRRTRRTMPHQQRFEELCHCLMQYITYNKFSHRHQLFQRTK